MVPLVLKASLTPFLNGPSAPTHLLYFPFASSKGRGGVKYVGSRATAGVQILPEPRPSCVALGKSLPVPVPPSPAGYCMSTHFTVMGKGGLNQLQKTPCNAGQAGEHAPPPPSYTFYSARSLGSSLTVS